MRTALAFIAGLVATTAYADTLDFAFLVEQRVASMECRGYSVDPIAVEDAIFKEGDRLGWSRQQTIRELEGRRVHQVAKHKANPAGYCRNVVDMEEANKNRLRSLGGRP